MAKKEKQLVEGIRDKLLIGCIAILLLVIAYLFGKSNSLFLGSTGVHEPTPTIETITNLPTSTPQTNYQNNYVPSVNPSTPIPVRNKVMINIDDNGGITKGSFYCYADMVNHLADLQNLIRMKQITSDSCTANASSEGTNCSHANCSSLSTNDNSFNDCSQKCYNDAYAKCNSDLGDLRKQLHAEVYQDCP